MKPAGFILLVEHGQHIALLDDAAAGKLLKSLFRYAKDGSTSELPADAAVAFSFIKAFMDENAEKYAQTIEKRRAAGRLGGLATSSKMQQNPAFAESATAKPPKQKQRSKQNDILDNADKPRRPRFIAPDESDVLAFFAEQGSTNSEAASFYDYYTANGWTQGRGKPIKDWRAAARSWIRRAGQFTQRPSANSETSPLEIYRNL